MYFNITYKSLSGTWSLDFFSGKSLAWALKIWVKSVSVKASIDYLPITPCLEGLFHLQYICRLLQFTRILFSSLRKVEN